MNVQVQHLVFRHHSLILPLAVANAMPNLAGDPHPGKETEVRVRSDYGPLLPPFKLPILHITASGLVAGMGSFRVFMNQGKRRGKECKEYIAVVS